VSVLFYDFMIEFFLEDWLSSIATIALLIFGYIVFYANFFKLYKVSMKTLRGLYNLFRLLGILFITLAVISSANFYLFKYSAEEAVGEIIYIEKEFRRPTSDVLEYVIRVKYSVEGVEYQSRIKNFLITKNKSVGDSITVYYKPGSPRVIRSSSINETIRLIILGTFYILGFLLMLYQKRKNTDDTPQSDYEKAMQMLKSRE